MGRDKKKSKMMVARERGSPCHCSSRLRLKSVSCLEGRGATIDFGYDEDISFSLTKLDMTNDAMKRNFGSVPTNSGVKESEHRAAKVENVLLREKSEECGGYDHRLCYRQPH